MSDLDMTPSAILLSAAVRVRDLAAEATRGTLPHSFHWVSPDLGPLLADWLETEAACVALVEGGKLGMSQILDAIEPGAGDEDAPFTVSVVTSGSALAFARAILGSGVDTP